MEWSPQQDQALMAINEWLRTRDPLFKLFGYAGTGKTTLIRHIAGDLGGNSVAFVAPTGKAALVMRRQGCKNADTIHSLIYIPKDQLIEEAKKLAHDIDDLAEKKLPRNHEWERRLAAIRKAINNPEFVLRESLGESPPSLIVVDECSMVDREVGHDLMGFGTKVLVIGDPGQLPPVEGSGHFMDGDPDVMLTEVHRQALDSPIIRMATTVRNDGAYALPFGPHHVKLGWEMSRDFYIDHLVKSDQVLVGFHKSRRRQNAVIRGILGYHGEIPLPGEKLVCWRTLAYDDRKLLNGSMWTVKSCEPHHQNDDFLVADLLSREGDKMVSGVVMHAQPFRGEQVHPEDRFDAAEFEYGYCLTTHKAQGSQWAKVTIMDEWHGAWCRDSRDRWLYTAITRAIDGVMVGRMYRRR